MLLAGEYRRTTETFLKATLTSTNFTWSNSELNTDLRGKWSATNRVIQARLSKSHCPTVLFTKLLAD